MCTAGFYQSKVCNMQKGVKRENSSINLRVFQNKTCLKGMGGEYMDLSMQTIFMEGDMRLHTEATDREGDYVTEGQGEQNFLTFNFLWLF